MVRRVLFALVIGACSRSPEATPPVVAVEAVSSARPPSSAMPITAPVETAQCEQSFVEIVDAGRTVRYELGREIVPGKRGAKHAFAEEIIHSNGEVVFAVEGLAKADGHGGNLSIVVTSFKEPSPPPAVYEGRVIFMPPDKDLERDERWMEGARIEITKWGGEGTFIEGTFAPGSVARSAPTATIGLAPSASPSARPAPRASSSARPRASASVAPLPMMPPPPKDPYRGRFKVCRTTDWRPRH